MYQVQMIYSGGHKHKKKSSVWSQVQKCSMSVDINTVDGQNPAPPGMVKSL